MYPLLILVMQRRAVVRAKEKHRIILLNKLKIKTKNHPLRQLERTHPIQQYEAVDPHLKIHRTYKYDTILILTYLILLCDFFINL
jgi:hypothetical protein